MDLALILIQYNLTVTLTCAKKKTLFPNQVTFIYLWGDTIPSITEGIFRGKAGLGDLGDDTLALDPKTLPPSPPHLHPWRGCLPWSVWI